MKHNIFPTLFHRLYNALVDDRWLIAWYAIVIFFPDFRFNASSPMTWSWQNLPLCFISAFLLCLVGRLAEAAVGGGQRGRWLRRGWHVVVHAIVYFISFLQIYLVTGFGLLIDFRSLQLLLQTHRGEALELLRSVLLDKELYLALLTVGVLGLGELLTLRKLKAVNPFEHTALRIPILAFLGLGVCNLGYVSYALSAPDSVTAYERTSKAPHRYDLNPYVGAVIACRMLYEQKAIGAQVEQRIRDTRVEQPTDYRGDIVVIIGESHIKRHSQLYGYAKPTNPLLSRLKAEGRLYVFTDVVAPINMTHIVWQECLSVSSLNDGKRWYEATLFPAVFKAAGWNVALASNQFTNRASEDVYNAAIDAFLNRPKVAEACFTTTNATTFPFDGEMVDSFVVHRKNHLAEGRPTLTIVNLLGQHTNYEERCPKSERTFKASDYADRKELTDRQRQAVADYDNACRYNDRQLYRLMMSYRDEDAIVIYFADHGDEVHDYRDHIGRAHDLKANGPESYRYQIEVPFFVYVTEKYRARHPEKVKQLAEAVNRPFMTDDIGHLLFYLGRVRTQWFDRTKCLIHPAFNTKRERILQNGDNYDRLR